VVFCVYLHAVYLYFQLFLLVPTRICSRYVGDLKISINISQEMSRNSGSYLYSVSDLNWIYSVVNLFSTVSVLYIPVVLTMLSVEIGIRGEEHVGSCIFPYIVNEP